MIIISNRALILASTSHVPVLMITFATFSISLSLVLPAGHETFLSYTISIAESLQEIRSFVHIFFSSSFISTPLPYLYPRIICL